MATLGYSSKLNAGWDFLTMLREEGRKAADAFLEAARRQYRQALLGRSRRAAAKGCEPWA